MTFTFYTEHPDPALHKIMIPENIIILRTAMRSYLDERCIGAQKASDLIHKTVQRWAHPVYQAYVSKTLGAENLRDFMRPRGASNLIEPARLLVHVFIWITSLEYRDHWGEFIPLPIEGDGCPCSLPGAPAMHQDFAAIPHEEGSL